MSPWNAYKSEAKARGSLAFELYVVTTTPVGAPEDVKASISAHLEYQTEKEAEGVLVLAGPLSDETGEEMQGMGMIVYRAASLEAARVIAQADPMHSSGARNFTLRKWMVNEGNLNISVNLAGQKVTLS